MKIAILAAEAAPYAKTGGLGDVMEALPSALAGMEGNEVILMLPYYHKIKYASKWEVEYVGQCHVTLGWRRQYAGILKLKGRTDGVQVYFIDNEYYFGGRDSALYGHGDDCERYAFFSRACLDVMSIMGWVPDVIHCNDWQTALTPVYLKSIYHHQFPETKVMYTIHNIEYQGWADCNFFDDVLALPWEWRCRLDMHGNVNLTKAAIETADWLTTVSETHAQELMYSYFAYGLDGIVKNEAWKLTGITNGIDTNTFNPETDPALPANYNADSFTEGKTACKLALQKEVGLPVDPDAPLCVMVTRLAGHKGLDLLCYIARRLLWEENAQLLILGTGEPHFEDFFKALAQEFPDRVAAKITFDLALASRIYAGGDIYLMPSRTESCGLSQMNAMRYGTVPVVHSVGGLRDSVPPCDECGNGGLGFTFQSYNGEDFYASLKMALKLYNHNRTSFRAIQKRGMEQDFSWNKPAEKYMELFTRMVGANGC